MSIPYVSFHDFFLQPSYPRQNRTASNDTERVIFLDRGLSTSTCWYILLIIKNHNYIIKRNILPSVYIDIYLISVDINHRDDSASIRCDRYTFRKYHKHLKTDAHLKSDYVTNLFLSIYFIVINKWTKKKLKN